jgi:hypothetical protein
VLARPVPLFGRECLEVGDYSGPRNLALPHVWCKVVG